MTILEYQLAAAERELDQMELDHLAVLWRAAAVERLELDRKSKKLKDEETIASTLLIQQMRKTSLFAHTPTHEVSVNREPEYVPHVMDWEAYWGFIIATLDFSLLEKRPGKSACQERWDAGQTIPGVEKYPVYKLTMTKG